MFVKNKVSGVTGNTIRTNPAPDPSALIAASVGRSRGGGGAHEVTAALGYAGGGPSSANLHVKGFWQSNYQYYMTGIIPADPSLIDTSTLQLFYRDMYLFDNTAGSAVDIQSTFPFSDFELRGVEQHEERIYQDALARLNIRQMMPQISIAYLVDGFFCGSLVFDPKTKQFIDTLIHDALQCAVIPSPFFNIDPTINVRVGQATQQFMHDTSPYARAYLNRMPAQFREMLQQGAFTLDPVSTLFVARRTLTDRSYLSYLHRILPMYLIEKTMFRGTLVEAQRRQRAMTHITAGDDVWTPTGEELGAIVEQFQAAEYDPLGGWITTRNAVQAVDLRPGGDFWKWTDMADILVPYKLRALGISESFLSGDASYAAAESAYSTFLESQNAYRSDLTDAVFYRKLFPLIAVVNGLYKNPANKAKPGRVLEFLFNSTDRDNLKMPKVHWQKDLEPKGEENLFEMLGQLSEKGVPIPLKMWIAAAGVDFEGLMRDLKEDDDLRDMLQEYTGKDTSHEGEEGMPDDSAEYQEAKLRASLDPLTTQSFAAGARRPKVPLLARKFGEGANEIKRENKSGSGFQYVHNQKAAHIKQNEQITKIATQAKKDANYRKRLAAKNQKELGYTTIPLANALRGKR